MLNPNLREAIRIKKMAEAAARAKPNRETGNELGATYTRLREQAKQLATRAGWNDNDEFDAELPELGHTLSVQRPGPRFGGLQSQLDARARGERAVVFLGQLEAWCAGVQEAFELEAQMAANAKAKVEAEKGKSKPGVGFGAALATGTATAASDPTKSSSAVSGAEGPTVGETAGQQDAGGPGDQA